MSAGRWAEYRRRHRHRLKLREGLFGNWIITTEAIEDTKAILWRERERERREREIEMFIRMAIPKPCPLSSIIYPRCIPRLDSAPSMLIVLLTLLIICKYLQRNFFIIKHLFILRLVSRADLSMSVCVCLCLYSLEAQCPSVCVCVVLAGLAECTDFISS